MQIFRETEMKTLSTICRVWVREQCCVMNYLNYSIMSMQLVKIVHLHNHLSLLNVAFYWFYSNHNKMIFGALANKNEWRNMGTLWLIFSSCLLFRNVDWFLTNEKPIYATKLKVCLCHFWFHLPPTCLCIHLILLLIGQPSESMSVSASMASPSLQWCANFPVPNQDFIIRKKILIFAL